MIKRLRVRHTDDQLKQIYAEQYDSSKWKEHKHRVDWTTERLRLFLASHPEIQCVADLSCGDGAILNHLDVQSKLFGDLIDGPHIMIQGDVFETIKSVTGDMLICSETLEHLDDPGLFLDEAARRFKWICITTPLGEEDPAKNYEHYWGWDLWGISHLLNENGWAPRWIDTLNEEYYTYQLWIARTTWH